MAKENSKETKYKAALQALGIYDPAFDPVIHQLCVLEREASRTRKAWNATTPPGVPASALHPLYDKLRQQERDIFAMRDALGLTPKGYKRLARNASAEDAAAAGVQTASPVVRELLHGLRAQAAASVSTLDTGEMVP